MAQKLKLRTLLQDYPWNESLKRNEITSPLFDYAFDDVKRASEHFKPMACDGAYDCGELAIVTYLQAKAYNKPLCLLPFVVSGEFHHESIAFNCEKGDWGPKDLPGKKVGVRSYAQTTGVWVRGVLQHEYGVDLDEVTFVTFQDSHLAEYTDPPNCVRAAAGKKLKDMVLSGEIDAGILDRHTLNDLRFKTLVPDADAAAQVWSKKRGIVPINHMYVVKKDLVEKRPDVVREVFRTLVDARKTGPQPRVGVPSFSHGVEANRTALETVIDYAYEQKVIPRKFSIGELFDDVSRILG